VNITRNGDFRRVAVGGITRRNLNFTATKRHVTGEEKNEMKNWDNAKGGGAF